MTTSITTQQSNFDTMQRMAMALYKSGYFQDAKSEAQAIVKVMAGAELGLPAFAAMSGIHVIQGKPTLGANLIATLIKQHPDYNYRVMELTGKVCKIQFFENGEPCGVSEFSESDARNAKVKNMDKFARNMLFARAISNGARWFAPDVFGGAPAYTPNEMGKDTDENGYIVDHEPESSKTIEATYFEDIVEEQDKGLFIKFQTLGKQAFGKEWDETRPKFVAWLTNDAVTSSKDLSNTSLQCGVDKLNLRIKSNEEKEIQYEKYLSLLADCYKNSEEQGSVMEAHANQHGLSHMQEAKVATLRKFISELQARLYAEAESVGDDAPF